MLSSLLIIASSLVLLIYWFRYSCILILRNQAMEKESATARFRIAGFEDRLQLDGQLDPLQLELARDYKVLTYLLEHAAGLELASFEHKLLVWDYRLMQWQYRLTRSAAPTLARRALAEMSMVMGVLAQHIEKQAGASSQV